MTNNEMIIHNFESFEAFRSAEIFPSNGDLIEQEKGLIKSSDNFTISGECFVCKDRVDCYVDFIASAEPAVGEERVPNWRERLLCPICHLNNRMRAVVHLLEHDSLVQKKNIYITEQMTHLYLSLEQRYPGLVGSEYLGPEFDSGYIREDGIRHEDMTQLSFKDASFDSILSFDVLEHVPDYRTALTECARCLKPDGGELFLTMPFLLNSEETLVRASLLPDGEIEHICTPEFHGDPINPSEGILCFYHYGWDVLETLREVGFANSSVKLYWSRDFGYLGGYQVLIHAERCS